MKLATKKHPARPSGQPNVILLSLCLTTGFLLQSCDDGQIPDRTERNLPIAAGPEVSGPAALCASMSSKPFDGFVVDDAIAVVDRDDLPGFCSIRGTIDPRIGFEARFPLEHWNGKFYQAGCGGYCGSLQPDKPGFANSINEALKKGFATITTDGGHEAWVGDASWAKDDPVAVEVYAHKVLPLTHRAGTRLVESYYGTPARFDYFGGCSNGGRLAAMAAQRYPELFDGILGGGGVLDLSRSGGIYGSWIVQANTGADGERILNHDNFAHKLPLLEKAVLKQCDHSDGVEDGIVSTPRNCTVDLTLLPGCEEGNTEHCFTDVELEVMRKWYQGPRDSSGNQLFPGIPAGSERFWVVWFLDTDGQIAPGNGLGGDYAKYLGFEGGAPDDFTALDFDFDRDPARLETTGRMLDATDSDLRAFRDAGGKYLLWHGWQDPLVLPDQTVDWYESIVERMGGVENVDPFMRLFMIPGKGHCWEMPAAAPDRFDPIAILDRWVEGGEAPAQMHVSALDPGSAAVAESVVCPYPAAAVRLDGGYDPGTDYCGGN